LIYITTATTTTLPLCHGIILDVNTALAAGTIIVKDGITTVAVITNPGISERRYYGFSGIPSIVTNAVCDVTISIL
jgi:hypothetical protein